MRPVEMRVPVWLRWAGLTGLGVLIAWLVLARVLAPMGSGPQRSDRQVPVNVPLAVDKTLGINGDLSKYDAAEREDALEAMQACGFRWLRQRFAWDAIEPQRGLYDWAVWDDIVQGATHHQLKLIAVLDGSPAWARAAEDAANPLAPPTEPADLGAFAAAVAARYGAQIDYFQIWDEPNIAPHWGARQVDPAGYARLLREGSIQVRTADPGAVILAAALAPNVEPGGANMSDVLFLDGLYGQGASEWFDVVAVQPYGFEAPFDVAPDSGTLNWRRPELLRDVMEAHDDSQAAIWAASFGWDVEDPGGLTAAVEQARREWPWLGPMLWAAWSPADMHAAYALTSADGASPSVTTLNDAYEAIHALATDVVVAWPGAYPANHVSGQYEGAWRVTPFGADIGQSGDRLRISFEGTRLDLTVRRGDYRAFLFVTVDGGPANALPRDPSGRSYVVLYDPLHDEDTVTLASGLPDGPHVAEIEAERGWGQWAIVGWTVSRPAGRSLPWPALGLGGVVLAALSLAIAWQRVGGNPVVVRSRDLVAPLRNADERVALAIAGGVAVLMWAMVGTFPSVACLALLALLLVLWPKVGLPLIALSLPFYQLGKPLLGKVFSMAEILTLLTALGWLANQVLGVARRPANNGPDGPRRGRLPLTGLDWGVLALLAAGALSLLWAENARVAAREYRTVVLESVIFYGLMRVMVTDRRTLWRVADAWVLGGALIALVGLFQWSFGQSLIAAEGVWRVRGFYGSPNNLALYLGRVLPVCVAVGLWSRVGPRRWAYALAMAAIAAAILLSYSRGAWLLGVPVSLLFLAAVRGRRTFLLALGLLLVVAVGVVVSVGAGRLGSLVETGEGTTFLRLQLWRSSWAMIRDHPFLGVGLDNFLYHYRTQYVLPTAWQEFDLSHPHNIVLDFWLRLGALGLVVLGWLVVAFFQRGWRTYRFLSGPSEGGLATAADPDQFLVLGLMGGMVNVLAHGLVDNAFFLVDLAFAYMLLLALVQALGRDRQLSETPVS